MKEQIISIKTAKLVNEKGFDLNAHTNSKASPTQSLIQKWLREEHKTDVQPICTYEQFRYYHLGIIFINDKKQVDSVILKDEGMPTNRLFDTYEEALEEGLQEALKLLV